MSAHNEQAEKVTVRTLRQMKERGEKIASMTAYDAAFANALERAGIDFVLVGDSLGMVVQGHETTIPVTVDEIIYHSRLVARGLDRAMLMADMPFMSYASAGDCLKNAARLMKEGGAEIVKLEWGELEIDMVARLTECGVPVCAHLGLTPQAIHKYGGYRVQGREEKAAAKMKEDARALEEAGADILLLECVPMGLAAEITRDASVPVIGIGAGPDVDGQILVLYDILDITQGKTPRFVRNFQQEHTSPLAAVEAYVAAVKDHSYPAPEHCFS